MEFFMKIIFFLTFFVLSACDVLSLNVEGNKQKYNFSFSNTIKIESINNNKLTISFEAYPNIELEKFNFSSFKYCINILNFSEPIVYNSNYSLINEDDFNCDSAWYDYEDLDRIIDLENNHDYLINIILDHNEKKYLYNRLIVNTEVELLPSNISCLNLLKEINQNKKIVLSSDINCSDYNFHDFKKEVSNLYLYGNSYSINNLELSGVNENCEGFISVAKENSFISSLKINNAILSAKNALGSLVGCSYDSSIENISVSAKLTGINTAGGIVAASFNTLLINNNFIGSFNFNNTVGGIAGFVYNSNIINNSSSIKINNTTSTIGGLFGIISGSLISKSNSEIIINASSTIGGLVGSMTNSVIETSYSNGYINSSLGDIGGLVGIMSNSEILKSYSRTSINSQGSSIGGLIGYQSVNSIVEDSYAIGEIKGLNRVGGLVGLINNSKVMNSYSAIGLVEGNDDVNGLIGKYVGTINQIENNYTFRFDSAIQGGITMLDKEAFSNENNFIGFDFENTWFIRKDNTNNNFIRPDLFF